MADDPKNAPTQDAAYLKDITFPQEVRYMTEPEEARARLKASIDALTEQASLQVQMQKEPLKLLGGASAVGGVLGLLVGRQLRRSKKIYVDAESPLKQQRALMKAQSRQQSGSGVGGALIATLGTLAFRQVMEKVVTPRLEEVANGLLDRAGHSANHTPHPQVPAAKAVLPPSGAAPGETAPGETGRREAAPERDPVASFLKTPAPAHAGVISMPPSQVEAKAVGTPIPEAERLNPNAR